MTRITTSPAGLPVGGSLPVAASSIGASYDWARFTVGPPGPGESVPEVSSLGAVGDATDLAGAYDVVVDGNLAYVVTGITNLRMTVVDISDPYQPTVVGTTGVVAGASQGSSGIAKKGDYVFFGTAPSTFSNTLYVYDVSNPAARAR